MATTYSTEMTGVLDGTDPPAGADPALAGGVLHCLRATIALAAQASGDDIVLGKLPKGAVFAYGVINASATLGASATVAIGYAGATGAYRAAAVFTAAAPTLFGVSAAKAALAAEKTILATVAVAALPGAGTAYVDIFYTLPEGG